MAQYKPYVDENGIRYTEAEHDSLLAGNAVFDPYPEGYWTNGEGSNYHGYGDDPGWPKTIAVMSAFMGYNINLLEVGCANGYFTAAAARVFEGALGIDLSEYAVSHPAPGADGLITVGDATDLPLLPATRSPWAICSWEMLEHLEEEDAIESLRQMVDRLPPGGMMWHRIALETDGDQKFDGKPAHNAHDDETHVTIKPESWWRDTFKDLGLIEQHGPQLALDKVFADRDWWGRFFVYAKPTVTE